MILDTNLPEMTHDSLQRNHRIIIVKEKTIGPHAITHAKAHNTKPRLNTWLNRSFNLHQKCNLKESGIFWSSPSKVISHMGPLSLPQRKCNQHDKTRPCCHTPQRPPPPKYPGLKIILFFC